MTISRRELLKLSGSGFAYIIGSQLFFGEKVSAEIVRSFKSSKAAAFIDDLPAFDGIYFFDPLQIAPYADDFGHSIHKIPLGVLQPAHAGDIQKLSRFCNDRNIKVTMRGTGGAAYGQTQLDQGIIIDSSSMKAMSWVDSELVQLEPGLIWMEVLDFTMQRQRTPPVMPDTLVTSVGGKANVGGIGETSFNLGAIVDWIVEFDLVTADGQLLTCNENQNPELFQAALGSMGQFGFIVRVVLKTMPVPNEVYSRTFVYMQDDPNLLGDLRMLTEEVKSGAIGGHFVRNRDGVTFSYALDVTTWPEENPAWLSKISGTQFGVTKMRSFYDYAHRNTKGWNDAVANGATKLPHPYLSFYLPYEECQEMSEFLLTTDLANMAAGRIMFVPLVNKYFRSSSFMLPESELTGHYRIYRIVRSAENGPEHQQMIAYNESVLVPKILSLGGKVYLPFSPVLKADQVREQFAGSYEALAQLEAKMDPRAILNAGAGLFRIELIALESSDTCSTSG